MTDLEKYSLQFRDAKVESILERERRDHVQTKFVQLSLLPGASLPKHHAHAPVAVIVLSGRIRLEAVDKSMELKELEMVLMEPEEIHALDALERSIVLLVVSQANSAPPVE